MEAGTRVTVLVSPQGSDGSNDMKITGTLLAAYDPGAEEVLIRPSNGRFARTRTSFPMRHVVAVSLDEPGKDDDLG